MAVALKTPEQIALLRAAGRLVAQTYDVLRPHVVPGTSTAALDRLAEQFIRDHGAEPLYKGYLPPGMRGRRGARPFPATICVAINDVVCHGIPSAKAVLREGDIVGVDIGLRLAGWVGDACVTYAVGVVDDATQRLLDTTQHCLELGIAQAQAEHTLGDVGAAIQNYAESRGFSVVREYTGHGLGHNLHEEPTVLHYGRPGAGLRLQPGMVFTIEPMINAGHAEVRVDRDGWTVRTRDGARSAQFEHTLAITVAGPQILTLP
jgi:methionyl aminopeptidase